MTSWINVTWQWNRDVFNLIDLAWNIVGLLEKNGWDFWYISSHICSALECYLGRFRKKRRYLIFQLNVQSNSNWVRSIFVIGLISTCFFMLSFWPWIPGLIRFVTCTGIRPHRGPLISTCFFMLSFWPWILGLIRFVTCTGIRPHRGPLISTCFFMLSFWPWIPGLIRFVTCTGIRPHRGPVTHGL